MIDYEFHHLHFRCSDVDATARFLIDNFNGKELFRRTSGQNLMVGVQVGGQDLYLSPKGPEDQIEGDMAQRRFGLEHLGLEVKDMDAAYEDLRAKGVQFALLPKVAGSLRIAFVLGPDNAQIEIIERK